MRKFAGIVTRIAILMGVLTVAACAGRTDPVSAPVAGWKLEDVSVRYGPDISRTATGNAFNSNFVWNGDGDGNRKKQVLSMFRIAMADVGRTTFTGSQPVKMDVRINYFHALTDWSRWFCCGEHRIFADIEITDAASGDVLVSGENVSLGRLALGGHAKVSGPMAA